MLVASFSGLLSAAFLDYQYYYLAWFAFVPLLAAVDNESFTATYVLGLIGGLCAYASGTYWIVDFLMLSKGLERAPSLLMATLVWFYCAQQIAIIVVVYKWLCRYSGCSELLLFPIVVALLTTNFPQIFTLRLGESQVNFPQALQAVEWVGVQGLDALIALVNIALFRLIMLVIAAKSSATKLAKTATSSVTWVLVFVTVSGWFAYGSWAYGDWQNRVATWSTVSVGIVQSNETPTLGKTTLKAGYGLAYPPEMEITEQLAQQGAKLVIWPEAQPKQYLNSQSVRHAIQSQVRELDINLLFQDTWQQRNDLTGEIASQYNSAIMLEKSGDQQPVYQKIKRMPFGEYLPWLEAGSTLHSKVIDFLGPFLNEINPGDQHLSFTTSDLNIVPLICYETTFPDFVAKSVRAANSNNILTKGTILVGLSNDGWFGSSRQPFQHVLSSTLRAVESRLPLVHVANNGPSIVVMPSGTRLFESDFRRTAGYQMEVPIPATSSLSFYSQYPYLLNIVLLVLVGLVSITAVRNWRFGARIK